MRLLGIDYGAKRVGLAISDENGRVAFPYATIDNDRDLFKKISSICEKEEISTVVLGESFDYQGKPNPIMDQIERFKEKLLEKKNVTVAMEPEYMTSVEAEKLTGNMDRVDAIAATIILQSYIDKGNAEKEKS